MYQTDWLLRQIESLGLAFRRMLQAMREHRPEDALEVSRDAVGELLDADPSLIDALTGDGLVALLSAGGGLDVFRAHMLGELLSGRAEALASLGRLTVAAGERDRARTLLRAALPLAEGADAERIAQVLGWLDEAERQ